MAQKIKGNSVGAISVLMLLVTVIGLIYYTWPKVAELKQAKADLAQAEADVTAGKEYIAKVQSAARKITEIAPQIELLNIAMPKAPDVPEALVQINDIVNANSLTITGLTPSVSEDGNVNFTLTVTGDYPKLKQSLADIENNLRPLKVVNISVNVNKDSESQAETFGGSYEVTLTYLKPVVAVPLDATTADGTAATADTTTTEGGTSAQ